MTFGKRLTTNVLLIKMQNVVLCGCKWVGLDFSNSQDNDDTRVKIFMILKQKILNYFRRICLYSVTD